MKTVANRVKVAIATAGTGTVTFGSPTSNAFFAPSNTALADGDVVAYTLVDGSNVEMGFGTIGGSVTTMTRDTVRISKISGTPGTTKLTLSGSATLLLTPAAEDLLFSSTQGANIASATTLNLETATGELVDVTGTTTITGITLLNGHERTVRFTGALTLTNGASLLLPGAANITTAAGDMAIFRGYAAGVVRCVIYTPIDGKAVIGPLTTDLTDATVTGKALMIAANAAAGQTALSVVPGTNVQVYNAGLTAFQNLTWVNNSFGYFTGASTAALATLTSVARTLLAQTTQALMRTTGLGMTATGDALATAASAAAAQSTLSVVPGTHVQVYNAGLTAFANLTWANDKLGYFTGASTAALADFTSVARTLLAQTTQALMRTTGLGMTSIGSAVAIAASEAAAQSAVGVVIGTDVQAYEAGLHGNLPQGSKSAAYTCVIGDANSHIYHPVGDNNARTFTIPANASVAYVIGTTLTFINEINTVTIAITTDTMMLAGDTATGSRTLAAGGIATAIKVTATRWIISGVGLT